MALTWFQIAVGLFIGTTDICCFGVFTVWIKVLLKWGTVLRVNLTSKKEFWSRVINAVKNLNELGLSMMTTLEEPPTSGSLRWIFMPFSKSLNSNLGLPFLVLEHRLQWIFTHHITFPSLNLFPYKIKTYQHLSSPAINACTTYVNTMLQQSDTNNTKIGNIWLF